MPLWLQSHRLSLLTAVCIALLYGLPNIFFIISLGESYHGIPLLQTPNEASYLARIQEVIDGHEALGSPFFFEYKNEPPLSPPAGEWLYALPAALFHLSPVAILIASKFILPPLLFLLVYALLLRLMGGSDPLQKVAAIAGGLLVVLGYDLVDYRTVFSYLRGIDAPGAFLLWARPVNPILGGIALFSFLLLVERLFTRTARPTRAIFFASLALAFMFGSYFFSWGVTLSVLAMLLCLTLLKKEWRIAGTLALIIPGGFFLAAPYWYLVWTSSHHPLYAMATLRSGLFQTHEPLLNKLVLAALALYIGTVCIDAWLKRRCNTNSTVAVTEAWRFKIENWHLYSLALLLGSLWVYTEQIVTGRTVWPYHFVQYTIPLVMVVMVTLAYHVIAMRNRAFLSVIIGIITACSVAFGVFVQMSAYAIAKPLYTREQSFAALFDFLNAQKSPCVVFTLETSARMAELNTLVPAFTHCDRYASTELFALIPFERAADNYKAILRLRGITGAAIDTYLSEHESEAGEYLASNWKGLFKVKDFTDFSDPLLTERTGSFPDEYRSYVKKDFGQELRKYRLDYIQTDGPLSEALLREIHAQEVFASNGMIVYAVK